MALLYPFSEEFKDEFFPLISKAFNSERGTRLDPKEFEILLTVPVKEGDNCGILLVTKRTDDFLNIRVRIEKFADVDLVGKFTMQHAENFSSSLYEVYWEVLVTLNIDKYRELYNAIRSPLYQAWLASDHLLYLENGGRLKTEINSFIKLQT